MYTGTPPILIRLITLGDLYPLTGTLAETTWEEVRARDYPEKPSRHGALFLFDNAETGAVAANWRPASEQLLLRARILRSASVHRGDLTWFDRPESEWHEAAAGYWSSTANPASSPIWECVIDGEVYFPDWKEPPFARSEAGSRPKIPTDPPEIVTCPVCRIEFKVVSSNGTIFNTADRSRCIDDPNLPILNDCPNVAPLVEAAWERMTHSAELSPAPQSPNQTSGPSRFSPKIAPDQ